MKNVSQEIMTTYTIHENNNFEELNFNYEGIQIHAIFFVISIVNFCNENFSEVNT